MLHEKKAGTQQTRAHENKKYWVAKLESKYAFPKFETIITGSQTSINHLVGA